MSVPPEVVLPVMIADTEVALAENRHARAHPACEY
jgi:hypothetical protein